MLLDVSTVSLAMPELASKIVLKKSAPPGIKIEDERVLQNCAVRVFNYIFRKKPRSSIPAN
jgi:hypothetical protein